VLFLVRELQPLVPLLLVQLQGVLALPLRFQVLVNRRVLGFLINGNQLQRLLALGPTSQVQLHRHTVQVQLRLLFIV
jgi:hypothetical protein